MSVADLITDITVEVNQDSSRYYEDNPEDRRVEDGRIVHRRIRLQNASTVSAFYLQDEWKRFAPLFKALIGLRMDYSTFTRERVFSPRLSLSYMLSDKLALRAGWGYFYQAANFASLFERFEREIEWNLFETITLKTEKSVHYLAGLEWDGRRAYSLKAEAYYKFLDDLVTPTDSTANRIPTNVGEGFAYGFEGFVQRRPSPQTHLSGWVGYSYSLTRERTPEKGEYYRDFDQRHTLNGVGRWRFTRSLSVDVRYGYGSGFPWTPVARDAEGNARFDEFGEVVWGKTNSERHPGYRRWDLRLSWERDRGASGGMMFYLEVINLRNRRNVFEYYWNDDYSRRLVSYMLPCMPFFGLKVRF